MSYNLPDDVTQDMIDAQFEPTEADLASMDASHSEYERVLTSRLGYRYGVRLLPDGSVDIAHLDPYHPSHDCPGVTLDGTSSRVLRDWLKEELA